MGLRELIENLIKRWKKNRILGGLLQELLSDGIHNG